VRLGLVRDEGRREELGEDGDRPLELLATGEAIGNGLDFPRGVGAVVHVGALLVGGAAIAAFTDVRYAEVGRSANTRRGFCAHIVPQVRAEMLYATVSAVAA